MELKKEMREKTIKEIKKLILENQDKFKKVSKVISIENPKSKITSVSIEDFNFDVQGKLDGFFVNKVFLSGQVKFEDGVIDDFCIKLPYDDFGFLFHLMARIIEKNY